MVVIYAANGLITGIEIKIILLLRNLLALNELQLSAVAHFLAKFGRQQRRKRSKGSWNSSHVKAAVIYRLEMGNKRVFSRQGRTF